MQHPRWRTLLHLVCCSTPRSASGFSIIVLTKTWCSDDKADKNLLWQLPNDTVIHQIRNSGRKGGVIASYIHISFNYKIPKN